MDWFLWFVQRLRPRPGWFPLLLLAALIGTLAAAVITARWIPKIELVGYVAGWGFLLGVVLALRPLSTSRSWALFLAYGLILIPLYVGQFPIFRFLFQGWTHSSELFRRQGLLLITRVAAWSEALAQNESSRETIVFALLVGFLAWLLAGYAAWTTFRTHQPLRGLTPIGVALALNHYFSDIGIWPVLLFIPLAALLAAAIHFYTLEQSWEARGVDYSGEIKLELLAAASAIALVLLVVAYAIPNLRLSVIAEAFQRNETVQEAEAMVERAFAGVRQPDRASQERSFDPGDGEVADGLPRALLIGSPPELLTTLVMTATVIVPDGVSPADAAAVNWRGLSYDVYTGRGWTVSHWDDTSPISDGEPIFTARNGVVITQTVSWQLDERQTRYSLGLPVGLDQDALVTWHGVEDVARVQGAGGTEYQIWSVVPPAAPEQLRQSDAAAIPPALLEQYTALPDNVPLRVQQLAQEITTNATNPYDQALALEQFLRQYPYSLQVTRPPRSGDLVDFFLFDLQTGYCDYYASAFVVMARSLGLPTRLVVGYKAVAPNERGFQRIVQADGHSWPELYFGDMGWIPFEPTAAYPSWSLPSAPDLPGDGPPEFDTVLTIPLRQPAPTFPWLAVIGLVVVIAAWLAWWRWQIRLARQDGIDWAYQRLQVRAERLGLRPRPSQTPYEFAAAFLSHLRHFPARWFNAIRGTLQQLADAYVLHHYTPQKEDDTSVGFVLWRKMARPLWLLTLWRKLSRRSKPLSP